MGINSDRTGDYVELPRELPPETPRQLPRELPPETLRRLPCELSPDTPHKSAALSETHGSALPPWPALGAPSDEQLCRRLTRLNKQTQQLDARLLLYLAELDRRGLYRESACSSLFVYCVSRLGMSEDVAWKRVGAARLIRRFPALVALLAEGRIHLSGLMLVGPHLTELNHADWLRATEGKSKREIEKLVAARCPRPDVPSQIRRLPTMRTGDPLRATGAGQSNPIAPIDIAQSRENLPHTEENQRLSYSPPMASMPAAALPAAALPAMRRARGAVEPLSATSYRIVFTAHESLKRSAGDTPNASEHRLRRAHLSPSNVRVAAGHWIRLPRILWGICLQPKLCLSRKNNPPVCR